MRKRNDQTGGMPANTVFGTDGKVQPVTTAAQGMQYLKGHLALPIGIKSGYDNYYNWAGTVNPVSALKIPGQGLARLLIIFAHAAVSHVEDVKTISGYEKMTADELKNEQADNKAALDLITDLITGGQLPGLIKSAKREAQLRNLISTGSPEDSEYAKTQLRAMGIDPDAPTVLPAAPVVASADTVAPVAAPDALQTAPVEAQTEAPKHGKGKKHQQPQTV